MPTRLVITNMRNPYPEIAEALVPYRAKRRHSQEFWVETENDKPIIAIRYPGKKVMRREGRYKWANLLDFVVVPFENGNELDPADFTFVKLLADFEQNKQSSSEFWYLLEEVYRTNSYQGKPPSLSGIDPMLYLLTVKWIWILEDLTYRLGWKEVDSSVKYIRLNKKGKGAGKRAGRAKLFAAMVLIHEHFSLDTVKSVIGLWG